MKSIHFYYCLIFLLFQSYINKGSNTKTLPSTNCKTTIEIPHLNIIYTGLHNYININPSNPNDSITVIGKGVKVQHDSNNHYIVTAERPGNAEIIVKNGIQLDTFNFQVKRIKDPTPRLGNKGSGEIDVKKFKTQGRIIAWIDNFGIDAVCKVVGYTVTRITEKGERITIENTGGRFDEALELQQMTTNGDIYLFENIKSRCPGEKHFRKATGSLVFRIVEAKK